MQSVFGLCATGSTPKNEVMRYDFDSGVGGGGCARVSLRTP